MSVKDGSGSGFVAQLEALRGFAALCVAVGHSMIWLTMGPEGAIWSKPVWEIHGVQANIARILIIFFNGAAAVDTFFVLSGFVLARSLAASRLDFDSYGRFVLKRLFRIVPAFWFSLLVVLLYLTFLYPGYSTMPGATTWFDNWYKEPLSLSSVVQNAMLMSSSLNPNAWTLGIELIASLLLPVVMWCLGVRHAGRSIAVLAVTLVIAWIYRDSRSGLGHYFYMFVLGAIVSQQPSVQNGSIASKTFVCGCMALIIIANSCFALDHPLGADILIVAGATGVIWSASAASTTRVLSILDSQWARFLGRISYSFYLLHFIIIYGVGNFLLHVLSSETILRWPLVVMVVGCILSVVLTIPFAKLAHIYVERPFMLLGQQLFQHRRPFSIIRNRRRAQ
jgi:peptidoglycan/LPS O-acetylase OafA/YrhL